MTALDYQQMVRAMQANDDAYDGRFYVGVHSTGIYCLPSCKARLPLLKNVVFYRTREEAIAAGLRGCRRCKSQQFPDVLPRWLGDVLAYMRKHRDEKLDERQLMQMTGVEISTVRRYFKTHIGVTPLAFHRRIRLQYARQLLEAGGNYLSVAFACGYESASGFRDAFIRQFGETPGSCHARTKNHLL
jgi:AraC family transcriptional regulator of adaptative response/methylated-DNA-[protein]-cysteine methyltransferase